MEKNVKPKFAVIAVDYEKWVPRYGMIEGLKTIINQTYQNFEIIICHDGPKERPYNQEIGFSELGIKPHIINTPEWLGDWGHHSRDYAMRYAYENLPDCDYYIQFNIDNQFELNAFEIIADKIDKTKSDIIIFTILHTKHGDKGNLRGIPPVLCNIDAMQLVAHKEMWKKYNFWYRYEGHSDGYIYQKMCEENNWVNIEERLGSNF